MAGPLHLMRQAIGKRKQMNTEAHVNEVATPWGIVTTKSVTYDEPHTVPTREQHEHSVLMKKAKSTRVAMESMRYKVFTAIADYCNTKGKSALVKLTGGADGTGCHVTLEILNVECQYNIDINKQYKSSGRFGRFNRSVETDRYRIVTGSYGNKSQYPQKKDGSFSWNKIGDDMIRYAERKVSESKLLAVQTSNKNGVAELKAEFGLTDWNSEYDSVLKISASANTEKPVHVKIDFKKNMTADEVRHLRNALKILGLPVGKGE